MYQLVLRPYYQLTKMTKVITELGAYGAYTEADGDVRTHDRVQKATLAYAIAPDASNFWSRPEIRFFYSYVHGNGVGNTSMPGTSEKAGYVVSQDNYFGAQIEAWF